MSATSKVVLMVLLAILSISFNIAINNYFQAVYRNRVDIQKTVRQIHHEIKYISSLDLMLIEYLDHKKWDRLNTSFELVKELSMSVKGSIEEDNQELFTRLLVQVERYENRLKEAHQLVEQFDKYKGELQHMGLSFTNLVEEKVISVLLKEESHLFFRGEPVDTFRSKAKDVAFNIIKVYNQQQVILMELIMTRDFERYLTQKRSIHEKLVELNTQLHYLAIYIGNYEISAQFIKKIQKDIESLMRFEDQLIEVYKDIQAMNNSLGFLRQETTSISNESIKAINSQLEKQIETNYYMNWIYVIVLLFVFTALGFLLARNILHFIGAIEAGQTALKQSLKEKELLIKEIYHRTKNNLLVILSYLTLELKPIDNDKLQSSLTKIIHRINAMALVHKRLHESDNLMEINLRQYFEEIIGMFFEDYQTERERIGIRLVMSDVHCSIDVAVPCGQILNELVVNSIKHAFPDSREGEITLKLSEEDNLVHITYADNGVGLPHEFDPTKTSSLGLQMVFSICEGQLHGSIDYYSPPGVEYRIVLDKTLFQPRL